MADLGSLLKDISRIQLEDSRIAETVPEGKAAAGWLGEPGATEAEIIAAEQLLGLRLPPSYRAFLEETNGFDHIGYFIYRLYSIAEIDWFRVRNQDWIDAYQNPINKEPGTEDITPEEHLANPNDSVRFRTAYLSSCLQISEEGDSAVVLLNPEVVNGEGEWEAWFFANWHPGALRYPSFLAYVESELDSILQVSPPLQDQTRNPLPLRLQRHLGRDLQRQREIRIHQRTPTVDQERVPG